MKEIFNSVFDLTNYHLLVISSSMLWEHELQTSVFHNVLDIPQIFTIIFTPWNSEKMFYYFRKTLLGNKKQTNKGIKSSPSSR